VPEITPPLPKMSHNNSIKFAFNLLIYPCSSLAKMRIVEMRRKNLISLFTYAKIFSIIDKKRDRKK